MKNLKDYYTEHAGKGSDKWDLYIKTYDEALVGLRNKPISLLEIGVQNGGSLEIWSKYFQNARQLIGCDIDEQCECLKYDDKRISLIIGDINEEGTRKKVQNISGDFDLIIDDGSHTSRDIVKTFLELFPKVKDDGIYIVEDLHCSYWGHYGGGLFHPLSSMNFFKSLVDVTNYQHWGNGYSRAKILERFCSIYGGELSEDDLSKIHSIQFSNSICIIKKKSADQNVLGARHISGTVFDVCEPAQINHHNRIVEASEFSNKWAMAQKSSEELEEEKKVLSEEKEILSKEKKILSDLVDSLNLSNCSKDNELKMLGDVINEKSISLEMITGSLSWRVTKPLRSLRRWLGKYVSF